MIRCEHHDDVERPKRKKFDRKLVLFFLSPSLPLIVDLGELAGRLRMAAKHKREQIINKVLFDISGGNEEKKPPA